MIRVLHKVHRMDSGGIQSFIMNVYRNIDRSKVQFDFLVSENNPGDYDEEIISLGGRIFQVPSRRQGIVKSILGLHEFFREHPEYKIIHALMSSLTNVSSLRVAKKHGIPYRIVHSHNTREGGSKIHRYIHRINQLSINSYATEFFACSDLAAKWMYPSKIYKNHNFTKVRNGIDTENFTFNKRIRSQIREEMDIDDKFVIGHIGRFHPQKNHNFLIEIFKEMYQKNNDAVLMLVGDGELRAEIETKVKNLGLSESVIFTGVRSDIPELLQAMDVFILPSVYEGLGIVLIEAQAAGLKCFASKNVVPKEVDISALVEFIDLDNTAQYWADRVLDSKDFSRSNTTNTIKKAGYDIGKIAEDLQKWYELKMKQI